ncbi:MAG TPA: beta-ketoacyl synthase N-terminal-like domain-containing protein [Geminicoccus sp.]|uniref:beta-ketoacyl synthase N-terminal-like domain-containing protein n=1 Tax=Geminicoccus sp. TaxID=2024832 RepID=UPI002B6D121E|nr:beta-ketoacyl synthase N-terminal-like domain-containing protein [Geminicoccus sp.]HWL69851.1 beta-ketoacyl synthase N-terminal-like domain-containing protein [Geminicoccus sp.]
MSGSIAIIGMAARYPGASDLDAFRDLLFTGRDAVSRIGPDELAAEGVPEALIQDPRYVPAAAVLDGIDRFDAARFAIPPHEAVLMDPQQRVLLQVAADALDDADLDPRQGGLAIGAFAGAAISTYLLTRLAPHVLAGPSSAAQLTAITGNDKDYVAAQLAYRLDLQGPVVSVQTACSTSLVAVHLACQSLLNGECDAALAGGVSIRVPHRVGYLHQSEGMLSPSGRCRSYGAEADGTIFGSGCGVVVLKRLDDALENGDPIRAVILGSAINNDGARKVGFSAPSQERQAAVVSEAMAVAGIGPDGIGCIEGHGTGTPLGDPIEVAALAGIFRGRPQGSVALGSVKSNIGHTETAAGIAGLIKAVLMLEADRLAPTLHAAQPNPRIGLEHTPFRLVQAAEPWQGPRRAGVSSFGIGGSNAHLVLEAATVPAPRPPRPAPAPGRRYWYLPPRQPGDLLSAATASGQGSFLHEADLSLSGDPFLADHQVDGRILLPGAAYPASLLERGLTSLEGLAIHAPVEIPAEDAIPFRLVLEPGRRARWFCQVDGHWQPAAEAGLPATTPSLSSPPDIAITGQLDAESWYARLEAAGLRFGPAFRSLTEVATGAQAARVRLRPGGTPLAVIDAGLQAVAAAFAGEDGGYLPTAFGRLDLDPAIASATTATARLETTGDGSVTAGIWWTDAQGRTVGQAQRVVCRKAAAPADPFYRLAWRADVPDRIAEVHERLERIAAGFAAQVGSVAEVAPRHQRYAALLARHAADDRRSPAPAEEAERLADEHPDHRHEIELVARTGRALPEILAGRRDVLDILFDGDGPTGAYAGSGLTDAVNAQVAAVAAGTTARRVLEIGGGTGATTAAILPVLPKDADYLFTDIGSAFLGAAAARFARHPGFRTGLLDITGDPLAQGMAADSFDLIVAANVLHVVPDLRQALAHIARLLAPGGRLLLAEGTASVARLDLVFGATDGWWSFADPLRPDHPLLPAERWIDLFGEAGLAAPATVFHAGTQAVLTAVRPPAGTWLALGGDAGIAAGLGLDWAARLPDGPVEGVVALPALAGLPAQEAVAQLAALARELTLRAAPPRLLVPTLSAERVAADERASADGAAITGFVRTLALEHPELRPRSVDLESLDPTALAAEMALADAEDRTAWRGGRRLRARLERLPPRPAPTWRLRPDLGREPLPRPDPGPGQVVVRVLAAGLNFKDVLIAGGLVPADHLGGECAGEVVALGSDVEGIALGQKVIAVGGGALAHYLVADRALVVPLPPGLSAAQGAALPVAGVTAWHATRGLAPGQRVLIHTATGGVGQFALRLAMAAGAEVVATAGTEERRAWLRAQGVAEVYPSRDTAFAATDPVDRVIGAVAGEVRRASLDLLRPGGRFIELGRVDLLSAEEVRRLRPDITYELVELDRVDAAIFGRLLRELVAAVAAEPTLLPTLTTLPLAEAGQALAALRQAEHLGKLVLLPDWPVPIRADGSYLVTGGRGGIGADVVEWLRERGAGAVLTLGRTPSDLPGAITGDVADPASLTRVADYIRAHHLPPLRGVIHAAGVLTDRAITGLTPAEIAAPLQAKLAGAQAIASAWPELELFLAFSSAGAVLGSPGQASHTAASAALDAFMAGRGIAIDWAAWAGKGAAVARGADARLARIGVGTIDRATALRAMDRALDRDAAHLVVLPIDWQAFRADAAPPVLAELLLPKPAPATPDAAPAPPERPAILGLDALRRQVMETCARLLPPGQPLDPRRALTDQGMDSLGALELRNRLGQLVGTRLSATLLFDHPSVEALVAHLATELGLVASQEPADPPAPAAADAVPQPIIDPDSLDDAALDEELARFERMLAEDDA